LQALLGLIKTDDLESSIGTRGFFLPLKGLLLSGFFDGRLE
jgi:hypothetical protein